MASDVHEAIRRQRCATDNACNRQRPLLPFHLLTKHPRSAVPPLHLRRAALTQRSHRIQPVRRRSEVEDPWLAGDKVLHEAEEALEDSLPGLGVHARRGRRDCDNVRKPLCLERAEEGVSPGGDFNGGGEEKKNVVGRFGGIKSGV
jgi:hypothetical protein